MGAKIPIGVLQNIPLAPYTTYKLGGAARYFIETADEAELQAALAWASNQQLPLFVLGVGSEAGAPVPLPDGGFAERDGVRVLSRMDTTTYGQWARSTGGRFVEADGVVPGLEAEALHEDEPS